MDKNKPINTSLNRTSEKGLNSALVPVRRSFWSFLYGYISYKRRYDCTNLPENSFSEALSLNTAFRGGIIHLCQSCHWAKHFDELEIKDLHISSRFILFGLLALETFKWRILSFWPSRKLFIKSSVWKKWCQDLCTFFRSLGHLERCSLLWCTLNSASIDKKEF